jgi:hypothetical protein
MHVADVTDAGMRVGPSRDGGPHTHRAWTDPGERRGWSPTRWSTAPERYGTVDGSDAVFLTPIEAQRGVAPESAVVEETSRVDLPYTRPAAAARLAAKPMMTRIDETT